MKKIFFAAVVILPLVFNSCFFENDITGLYVCGAYAVPGTFYPDLKGTESSYEILETDQYGRIMFSYSAPNFISEQKETAIVICQKITKDLVYFYEDICFEFVQNEKSDFQTLKNRNDWNQPLDSSKMTYRNNKVSFDNFIITESIFDINKVKKLCCEKLNVYSSEITELCIDDIRPDDVAVFYMEVTSHGSTKNYFVRVSDGYEISFYEFNNVFYEVTEEYIDFKNPV